MVGPTRRVTRWPEADATDVLGALSFQPTSVTLHPPGTRLIPDAACGMKIQPCPQVYEPILHSEVCWWGWSHMGDLWRVKRWWQWSGILLYLAACCGCKAPTAGPTDTPTTWLSRAERPTLRDDLDQASLRQAVQRSLEYVRRLPRERSLPCGDRQISAAALHQTLVAFEQLLMQGLLRRW